MSSVRCAFCQSA
ncbi:MAG: hypothetical protein EWV91_00850 [Microcystis aeruginosa Ma_QC_Ca_00000000_S207]|uniref:Uncharacterized protein n=4 Tax=Microcystis TaxID=1125 RepID=A0A552G4T6_MICAE|nr:MAG: hypothetical protein DWQ58_04580 [Microcystis aeruginosa TA09]TRT75410.1 MAG: hypothetical protein EWV84_01565 [Microcystis sp. M_QC_C_20170808_M3Col]TRU53981.1 MAG: hypothetical protein EWV91_00850 [Microcystis aeruginosa Ma_QC_Ca_00000000_S207]TRU55224.1 MAG: hypothetical protein EWV56_21135 [Microcystis aeruginosa Ma_QC_C_20070823_S13D]TRU59200.1 MAG: hypothetical protein EWV48_15310 [Microcystis aeruginosa Ma_QC_C_20070823_S13]TRU94108.1 MAG: hypothetical protein EWV75_16545 [Micro